MTAVFDRQGLRFQYPENWRLQQDIGSENPIEIVLETPAGAFWMLHAFPSDVETEPLLKNVVNTLDEQYDSLEVTPITETIADLQAHGFDAEFYCLDFLISAKIRVVETDDFVLLLLCQGESREFQQQNLVFSAISTSLLMELCNRKDTTQVHDH